MRPAFLAALIVSLLAGSAIAADVASRMAAALRRDPIYVAPGAERSFDAGDRIALGNVMLTDDGGTTVFTVVLPPPSRRDLAALAGRIGAGLERVGVVVVAAGGRLRAVQAHTTLPTGDASRLALEVSAGHRGARRPYAALADFVRRVGRDRQTRSSDSGGLHVLRLVRLVVLVVAGSLAAARRWRRRQESAGMQD